MKKLINGVINISLLAVLAYIVYAFFFGGPTEATYNQFMEDTKGGYVASAVVEGNTIEYTLSSGKDLIVSVPPSHVESIGNMLLNQNTAVKFEPTPVGGGGSILTTILISIIPVLLLIGAMFFLAKRAVGGAEGQTSMLNDMQKSKGRWVDPESNTTRMSDVALGNTELSEISQLIDFLKDTDQYTAAGGRIPKGYIMSGPPGVGKTLVAKAIAGEAGVKFYEVAGSEFDGMLVGTGASRVKDMFEEARKNAPCILFIDEIDSVAKNRDGISAVGGGQSGQTVAQLLTEMDGFTERDGVIIIAATNRPDIIDPAVMRPGRFDRNIVLGLPDLESRKKILDVQRGKYNLSVDSTEMDIIARGTTYFSGADLANLVNEAAIQAGSEGLDEVHLSHLEFARDKIIMGNENQIKMSDDEKEMTAYHEAGHVLIGALMPNHDPVYKVSIIPRGRALGVTAYLPEGEKYSQGEECLLGRICTLYGGRVAEEIIYGKEKISTGASNDIERATDIATSMVSKWGFSDLGAIHVTREMSDDTRKEVDERVVQLLKDQYERTVVLMETHKDVLHALSQTLLERETLTREEINEIIGDIGEV